MSLSSIAGLTLDVVEAQLNALHNVNVACRRGRGPRGASLTCSANVKDVALTIAALSSPDGDVTHLQVSVTQGSTSENRIAAPLLGHMAMVRYEGSHSLEARDWAVSRAFRPGTSRRRFGPAVFAFSKRGDREHVLEIVAA